MVRAPFPWFGGKATVAADVWARFGGVQNYVEPFFGSGAVLLNRPQPFDGPETINDKDGYVANFWRAVIADPEAVAHHADWPINERDLEARHYWLVTQGRRALDLLMGTPDGYDARIAGWWVWGICAWIGSGWCRGEGPWTFDTAEGWRQLPHLGDSGRGVNRQLPHLGDSGMGVNRQLPHLGNSGMGVNRQLPHLGNSGRVQRRAFILGWMTDLSERLRHVRVACGDWSRVCGPSVTTKHGLTAVFLDPPYSAEADRAELYTVEDLSVAHAVREWAIANGGDPLLRIALCGYDGEHAMPDGWACWNWKARGGYGSQGTGRGRDNASREVIWFSPNCLNASDSQLSLFGEAV